MLITLASHKGGVGKSTSAFHLAAYLGQSAPTLLVDGDPNRSVLRWADRSPEPLPFEVVDTQELPSRLMTGDRPEHIVTDTQARPPLDDLKSLAKHCDLMVVPTTPDALALDTLPLFLEDLSRLEVGCAFKFLITCIPPYPSTSGDDAKAFLKAQNQPMFAGGIRRYTAFEKAALAGVPIYAVADAKAQAGWSDYVAVAEEILNAR